MDRPSAPSPRDPGCGLGAPHDSRQIRRTLPPRTRWLARSPAGTSPHLQHRIGFRIDAFWSSRFRAIPAARIRWRVVWGPSTGHLADRPVAVRAGDVGLSIDQHVVGPVRAPGCAGRSGQERAVGCCSTFHGGGRHDSCSNSDRADQLVDDHLREREAHRVGSWRASTGANSLMAGSRIGVR